LKMEFRILNQLLDRVQRGHGEWSTESGSRVHSTALNTSAHRHTFPGTASASRSDEHHTISDSLEDMGYSAYAQRAEADAFKTSLGVGN